MFKNFILHDLVGLWLLLTGCLIGGLCFNEMRPTPLSLVYSSPQTRLDQSVENLNPQAKVPDALEGDVTTDEMQKISENHAAMILDARPGIFYRLGHIPSALSLPRDDFAKQYRALQAALEAHRASPLVVYCSDSDCHDSRMVADSLRKLGFAHVRLFRAGWSDWESANLPEEKEP
jgi:3-mercaptopyruvate sulfurtransferase SseA